MPIFCKDPLYRPKKKKNYSNLCKISNKLNEKCNNKFDKDTYL